MKRILIAMFAAVSLLSCGNAQNQTSKDKPLKEEVKMKTIHLTKSEFLTKVANIDAKNAEWKYLGDKPAIVDFYATWCGPCKSIAPVLEELAAEYGNEIYIYKVDVDQENELAAAFGIRSIPTMLFIPMEGDPQLMQGAMPKASFKEAIDKVLLKK